MAQPATQTQLSEIAAEAARRRTFAIISHPDAGKTTLTEKLLLYSNAVELAGSVRTRKNQRHAKSDWMAIEQERGISITSAALQFDYGGCRFNLLDTPGHQDFSEDTYRTLLAVDSAVMVLDAAKGIETQTKKLFEACRLRRIPILTFINKLDQPAQEPLHLLDEIEKLLGIPAVAQNWPIGDGPDFQGVFDIHSQQVLRFQRTAHGQHRADVIVRSIDDPQLDELLGSGPAATLRDDVELLTIAGEGFDKAQFLAGDMTPVYFGSALNNFGLEPFLEALLTLAPPPRPHRVEEGFLVAPEDPEFTAFVFKIQANMNPKHRDSIAFARVCSGKFEKDMSVQHPRLNRTIRLTRPYQLFAQDRTSLETAYPGDVVGLANPGLFTIGDSLSTGRTVTFPPIPSFEPEFFARIHNRDTAKHKQFHKGIEQLEKEGAIQRLTPENDPHVHPLLAAVGQLQFEVVEARLKSEYNVNVDLQYLPYTGAKRIQGSPEAIEAIQWPNGVVYAEDKQGRPVALYTSQWQMNRCVERNPDVRFRPFSELAAD